MNRLLTKRILDLVIIAIFSPIWLPVLGLVTVAVRLFMGPPVFFRQTRIGYHGCQFQIIKFRTMLQPASPNVSGNSDAERLTTFGRWLRSTSLDELPELINILRGDMSLVGPRPLLVKYLPLYSLRQLRRHEVPPGLTGLAQISGRNLLSWDERLEMDVQYVEKWTLSGDLVILLKTLSKVVTREGISGRENATMEEFRGQASLPPTPSRPSGQ